MSNWKNLHFRPPITKAQVIYNGRSSDLVLIRNAGHPETTFAGYVIVRHHDPRTYRICGRGYTERKVDASSIEWMEVPV